MHIKDLRKTEVEEKWKHHGDSFLPQKKREAEATAALEDRYL